MLKISEYGVKLQSDFFTKSGMQKDIDNGKFDGYWRYEEYIKTMEDVIGFMLECYDYEAINVVEEWIEDGTQTVWGFDVHEVKKELEKVFD